MKRIYGQSGLKNPGINALTRLPSRKNKQKCQSWIHYGALAATKWTNTSLTSKDMFLFLR